MVVAHGFYSVVGVLGVVVFVVVVYIRFLVSLVSWGAGVAYLGEVLHGLFFVWYDMGVRRFVCY